MVKRIFVVLLVFVLGSLPVFAQGGVGGDLPVPDLPQYDMTFVNAFFFQLLQWSPVMYMTFGAIAIGLLVMLIRGILR